MLLTPGAGPEGQPVAGAEQPGAGRAGAAGEGSAPPRTPRTAPGHLATAAHACSGQPVRVLTHGGRRLYRLKGAFFFFVLQVT